MDDIEVDQQPEGLAAELQVGNDLRLMNRRDCIDRLDLHDDEALHDQIHSIADFQSYSHDKRPEARLELQPEGPLAAVRAANRLGMRSPVIQGQVQNVLSWMR